MRVLTVEEMRQAEAAADAGGLSFARMMENAGSAVAQEMTGAPDRAGSQRAHARWARQQRWGRAGRRPLSA